MNISRVIFNFFRYLPLLNQPKINVKNIVNINSASYCYPYCVVHVLFHLYKLQPRLWCILECILFPVLQYHRHHLVNNHYVRTPLRKGLKGEEANKKGMGDTGIQMNWVNVSICIAMPMRSTKKFLWSRHGSRIHTDGFPKRAPKTSFEGVRQKAPPGKSSFLGFRVIQAGYWPDFNLKSFFRY